MDKDASGGSKAASGTSDYERKISGYTSDRARALADKLAGLVCLIQNGDEKAFEEFYEASKVYVINNIRSISSANEDLTQELAQEVYIKIFTNIRGLKEPQGVLKWVKVITVNTVRDYYKKAGVKHETLIKDEEERDFIFEDPSGGSLSGSMPLPEDIADNAAARKIVADAIKELPPDQFAVLAQFYYNEMSVKEIAGMYGISEGAVKTRLSRTRKALKEKLEKIEKDQGIRLRSVGVLPAFVYLLWLYMSETPVSDTVSASVKAGVFGSEAACGVIGAGAAVSEAAAGSASAGGAGSVAQGSGAAVGTTSSAAQSAGAAAGAAVKAAGFSAGIKAAVIAAAAAVAVGAGTGVYFGVISLGGGSEIVSEETAEAEDYADNEESKKDDAGSGAETVHDEEADADNADSAYGSDNSVGTAGSSSGDSGADESETAAASETSAQDDTVSGPEAALADFEDAVNARDSEAVLECFDEETRALSEEMMSVYGMDMADILSYYFNTDADFTDSISISGVVCKEDEDTAVLSFSIIYESENGTAAADAELEMVLEDGQWKIKLGQDK